MNIKQIINEEIVNELRTPMLNHIKQLLPNTPDYVLQDLFYNALKDADPETINSFVNDMKNVKWELKKNIPINYNTLDDDTISKLKQRAGGKISPYGIPNDAERHKTQQELINQKCLPQEPIIMFKNGNKLELLEGWHRIIQLLSIYPNGFNYPNVYIGTK